jgi:hypothetical protein
MPEDQNPDNPAAPAQPGTVISPGAQPTPQAAAPPAPDPAPTEQPAPSAPPAATPAPALAKDDFVSDESGISWTASEFIHHDKSAGWYVFLAVGTVLLAAAAYLLTRGFVSVAVIIIAGIVMGIYASHTPRELQYRIDDNGITVGHKTRSFDEFRSFAVVPEGAFSSIVFMPLKRFAVSLSIYFAPQDEEQIVALLSDQLPFEGHQHDATESLMRRIRF